VFLLHYHHHIYLLTQRTSALNLIDHKMQKKMPDQVARTENDVLEWKTIDQVAGAENAGLEMLDHDIAPPHTHTHTTSEASLQ